MAGFLKSVLIVRYKPMLRGASHRDSGFICGKSAHRKRRKASKTADQNTESPEILRNFIGLVEPNQFLFIF
ncbi:hypothetical protein ASG47_16710 [Devosia sp. Leaf420]|nr:hypothetical protein ASG47_16710 [Devosia sp. Leaf420]